MKQFVFITHKTPAAKQSLLRKKLYELYLRSLQAQTYTHWKALVVGEDEYESGNFKFVKADASSGKTITEQLTALYERKDICEFIERSDYIVKLDDDDIISPTILEKAATLDFDVYFDAWHTFYDVTSGKLTQQERNWIASTCVHKTEHALAPVNNKEKNYYINSVLYSDHSKIWHTYYKNKKQAIAEKEHPVYLRVLSPTSITAGAKKLPLENLSDVDFKDYYAYLKSFGYWNESAVNDFKVFEKDLITSWTEFSGEQQKQIPGTGQWNQLLDKATHYYGKTIRKLFR